MWPDLGLCLLGVAVGTIGTLIGAGGGFLLAPILALLYADAEPDTLASISLAVVFANSCMGTLAYARLKRIAYRPGLAFAAAGVPGALVGAYLASEIARGLFELVLGTTMLVGAILLLLRPKAPSLPPRGRLDPEAASESADAMHVPTASGPSVPHLSPRDWKIGIAGSGGVGVLSSLLGIGGGIIHVPLLTLRLRFPVHTATATSHFVLAITSGVGLVAHIAAGSFSSGIHRAIVISLGALVGAPIGARLSTRLHGNAILRGLSLALAAVGVRMVWMGFRLMR